MCVQNSGVVCFIFRNIRRLLLLPDFLCPLHIVKIGNVIYIRFKIYLQQCGVPLPNAVFCDLRHFKRLQGIIYTLKPKKLILRQFNAFYHSANILAIADLSAFAFLTGALTNSISFLYCS